MTPPLAESRQGQEPVAVLIAHSSNAGDVGPKNINENVHYFVNPMVDSYGRSANPPPAETDAQQSAQNLAQMKKNCKDIGEKNCDEEVHGFVSANTPPLNEQVKSTAAFVPNGSDPKSFIQKKKNDIAEAKMDEEVHGFANHNVDRLPYVRPDQAYLPNGSSPKAWTVAQMKKHCEDIGETNCDEEVHGFVTANVPPLTEWERVNKPYLPNGSDPKSFIRRQTGDIANKEIRPDVWKTVHEMINPAPLSRTSEAPPADDDKDIQLPTEVSHSLEPIAFQYRANNNEFLGPRTTFYDKQNRLWRQEDQI